MNANLAEQDLTDYALNELGPNERLYVESMLAVDEESRDDIYKTIDLALMLERGFEREDWALLPELTPSQRERLVNVQMPNIFLRRSVIALAAAACVAFALVHRDDWLPRGSASQVARASGEVSRYVVEAVSAADGDDFVTQIDKFRRVTGDPILKRWLSTSPAVGAPSHWSAGPAVSSEAFAPISLDLMP